MIQLSFDAAQGQRLKEEGLVSVASHNAALLDTLRAYAKERSRQFGKVNSDHLRIYAVSRGLYPTHHNFWGSVLKGKGWRVVGRTETKLAQGHGREIREYVWDGA